MSIEQWTLVDRYITDAPVPADAKLRGLVGVEATTVQTVGSKGYDGFTLAIVG